MKSQPSSSAGELLVATQQRATISVRAAALVEMIRSALAALDGLTPGEQDHIVAALVADLRARRPVAVAPFGTLGPPTEAIRDPRRTP
jgi:hypothetical protein